MIRKQPTSPAVPELRAAIRKITGRAVVSNDPEFLVNRLASLINGKPETKKPVCVSMTSNAQAAGGRIADAEGISFSQLVRQALLDLAERRGYKDEVIHFKE